MNRPLVTRLMLLLLPLLAVGLFARVYYTPDEPREASLVASMAAAPAALPTLAGVPFAEKPPLLYWAGGAVVAAGGMAPALARVPNLLYALLVALSLASIARRAVGELAGLLSGVAALTMLQCYSVAIWLATDAPLLAGVALALAGLHLALSGAVASVSRRGYVGLAAGLLLAFFAKGPAGWMVPVFAALTAFTLGRRWRELQRPALWLAVVLVLVPVALWVAVVAMRPQGLDALRVLFWYNLAGRAVTVAAPLAYDYASGHQNSPGKYLLELPLYLMPWTPLACCACVRGWRRLREPGAAGTAWRLLAGAIVPSTLLLSCAATARGVYYAPVLLGFALAIGLDAGDPLRSEQPARGWALWLTRASVTLLATLLAAVATVLALAPVSRDGVHVALAVLAVAGLALVVRRMLRAGRTRAAQLRSLMIAVALTYTLIAAPLYLCLNPWLNLASTAAALRQASGASMVALYEPDETTLAMAELYFPHRPAVLHGDGRVPAATLVIAQSRDGGHWSVRRWLQALGYQPAAARVAPVAPARFATATVVATVERAGGRQYLVLRPNGAEESNHE